MTGVKYFPFWLRVFLLSKRGRCVGLFEILRPRPPETGPRVRERTDTQGKIFFRQKGLGVFLGRFLQGLPPCVFTKGVRRSSVIEESCSRVWNRISSPGFAWIFLSPFGGGKLRRTSPSLPTLIGPRLGISANDDDNGRTIHNIRPLVPLRTTPMTSFSVLRGLRMSGGSRLLGRSSTLIYFDSLLQKWLIFFFLICRSPKSLTFLSFGIRIIIRPRFH